MNSLHQLTLGTALVAGAIVGQAVALAGPSARCLDKPETFVGAFVGVPSITVNENGTQNISFSGLGTLTGIGDALCHSSDELFVPWGDPQVTGHYTLSGDRGESVVIAIASTSTSATPVAFDANGIPTKLHLTIEGTWTIVSGTGRYHGAAGEGVLSVVSDVTFTGPTTLQGFARWALWGDIAVVRPGRGHCDGRQ